MPYDPPVKDRADFYEHEGDRYAYEDIILLALLTTIRNPVVGPVLRPIPDAAAEVVAPIRQQPATPVGGSIPPASTNFLQEIRAKDAPRPALVRSRGTPLRAICFRATESADKNRNDETQECEHAADTTAAHPKTLDFSTLSEFSVATGFSTPG